jgi:L-aspartate oxidase
VAEPAGGAHIRTVDTDVLIVGSGIGGLFLAHALARRWRVAVVTKKQDFESNTNYAQGGIAVVAGAGDSFALHVRDTMRAGAGLCHPDVVRAVVREGPARIRDLIDIGVRFSRARGGLELGREGGHSARRIAHAADLTGREIERALLETALAHRNVRLREDHLALELATHRDRDGRRSVWGATVLDRRTGRLLHVRARATVLATGGSGKVYLYTSNPDIATGDGVAMAYRAGATVANLEFVQFHPTCLYHARAGSFLISEAVRGEGALLTTVDGHRFMPAVHRLAELAPRDIVARAIDGEMKRRGDKHVLLDLRPIGRRRMERRFPNIVGRCRELGFEPAREPLPVVPAAHYQCGGVRTDLFGRTDLRRLFAIGEVAMTGLHGANRLASNSLLEAVVFAHRAVGPLDRLLGAKGDPPASRPFRHAGRKPLGEAATLAHDWEAVRRTMWDLVGIVRSDERLAVAAASLDHLAEDVERVWRRHRVGADLVELRNLTEVARLIVACARRRRESRGLHYNLDHPRPLARYRRDTVLRRRAGVAAPSGSR